MLVTIQRQIQQRVKNYETTKIFSRRFKIKTKHTNGNCKPYFNLLKNREPLFRSINTNLKDNEIMLKKVRQDRRPLGTNSKVFKEINKWLEKNKHIRRDKSVIATSDLSYALYFGSVAFYMIDKNLNNQPLFTNFIDNLTAIISQIIL